jgi:predicted dehydrogenase
MAAKLKLGLIGTGVAARELYLPAFQRLGTKKVEVVACTNRTRKKAVAYARLAGIPKVVDSAEELIALPEVEAVFISVPIDAQPALVLAALRAGKPVLSEKPVAPSVAAGKKLLQSAARHSAVPWLVAENFVFMPAIQRLHAWIEQGKLGEIRLVQVSQLSNLTPKNPYFNTGWRQAPKHVGGFVVDAGVHLAFAVRHLLGTPAVVKNVTAQYNPALPPIDTALALLKFPSGALGTWSSCFSAHHGGPMLRIHGSLGTAELGWSHALLRTARGKETRFDARQESMDLQFSHFADVVKNGTPVAYTPEQALEDLRLIAAVVG